MIAELFGDDTVAAQILTQQKPGAMKALGRKVRGFEQAVWDANKCDIVRRGNLAKVRALKVLKLYDPAGAVCKSVVTSILNFKANYKNSLSAIQLDSNKKLGLENRFDLSRRHIDGSLQECYNCKKSGLRKSHKKVTEL